MKNLKKLNEAEVVSSDGFKVKYGKDFLTYIQGAQYIVVPIEHLGAPYEMEIYLNKASDWMEKGVVSGVVNQNELNSIESRIKEAMSFLKRNFSIV